MFSHLRWDKSHPSCKATTAAGAFDCLSPLVLLVMTLLVFLSAPAPAGFVPSGQDGGGRFGGKDALEKLHDYIVLQCNSNVKGEEPIFRKGQVNL